MGFIGEVAAGPPANASYAYTWEADKLRPLPRPLPHPRGELGLLRRAPAAAGVDQQRSAVDLRAEPEHAPRFDKLLCGAKGELGGVPVAAEGVETCLREQQRGLAKSEPRVFQERARFLQRAFSLVEATCIDREATQVEMRVSLHEPEPSLRRDAQRLLEIAPGAIGIAEHLRPGAIDEPRREVIPAPRASEIRYRFLEQPLRLLHVADRDEGSRQRSLREGDVQQRRVRPCPRRLPDCSR